MFEDEAREKNLGFDMKSNLEYCLGFRSLCLDNNFSRLESPFFFQVSSLLRKVSLDNGFDKAQQAIEKQREREKKPAKLPSCQF